VLNFILLVNWTFLPLISLIDIDIVNYSINGLTLILENINQCDVTMTLILKNINQCDVTMTLILENID
jgi:hypothetical protein